MPRRWGVNTRVWAYRFLVIRDGEQCAECSKTPTTQNEVLDIDHINGFIFDDDPDNLRLLCRKCNVVLGNKSRSPTTRKEIPSAKSERERKEGRSETRIAKEAVDYSQGSAEMRANYLYEVQVRQWVMEKVADRGQVDKADAIATTAELVGASPSTTAKYITKLTSSIGPLKEVKGMFGEKYLVLKDHLQAEFFHDGQLAHPAHQEKSAHREVTHPFQSGRNEAEQTEPTSR